jgi:hypothetical protein
MVGNPNEPWIDELLQNNVTVTGAGNSISYYIDGKTHVELLISVGTKVGNPLYTYSLNVIEPTSGKVIFKYDAFCDQSNQTNAILLDEKNISGTHVSVSWDGRIDQNNYFTNVYSRLVVK